MKLGSASRILAELEPPGPQAIMNTMSSDLAISSDNLTINNTPSLNSSVATLEGPDVTSEVAINIPDSPSSIPVSVTRETPSTERLVIF